MRKNLTTSSQSRARLIPGFTMVELLIYMGIFSIFLTILGSVFISILDVQLESESTSVQQMDGRFILSRLTHDIHRASSITTPASDGQTSTTLALDISGVTHTFSVNNNSLQVVNNLGTNLLTTNYTQISSFSATRIGNTTGRDTLQINFTLTNLNEIKDYQTTIGLR